MKIPTAIKMKMSTMMIRGKNLLEPLRKVVSVPQDVKKLALRGIESLTDAGSEMLRSFVISESQGPNSAIRLDHECSCSRERTKCRYEHKSFQRGTLLQISKRD